MIIRPYGLRPTASGLAWPVLRVSRRPLYCKGVLSCFPGKLAEGTCCKSADVNELENPQITQISQIKTNPKFRHNA